MPPLEKALVETISPPCTMLLTASLPPSRTSSSNSTTNTTTSSATASSSTPSTIEKMATSTTLLSRRSKLCNNILGRTTEPLISSDTTPPNFGTTKKKKHVHFGRANGTTDPQVEMQLIPHVTEFDDETRTNLWFTGHELDRTMKEATRTIIAVNNGELFTDDDPDFTPRGLEYMTPTGFNIASSSQQAVTMVLSELNRQRHLPDFNGQIDTNLLADSIQAISRHRQRIAHLAAMKDARTVHGQGNFRCQVVQPSEPTTIDGGRGAQEIPRGSLRASGSMEDIRRRRHISRTTSSRRELRHSVPALGSDPMVQLSAQVARHSMA